MGTPLLGPGPAMESKQPHYLLASRSVGQVSRPSCSWSVPPAPPANTGSTPPQRDAQHPRGRSREANCLWAVKTTSAGFIKLSMDPFGPAVPNMARGSTRDRGHAASQAHQLSVLTVDSIPVVGTSPDVRHTKISD